MADLNRYKVMQATPKDGVVSIPKDTIPLGIVIDPETGDITLIFLMPYDDWVTQYPEQVDAELNAKTQGLKVKEDGD